MQKNELVTVTIEDIGINGEGIGKVDGYTLFIKDAIIGDVVEAKVMKAKKNYGYARLMNILTPSPYRVKQPKCPMARKCGGCQIQEMEYDRQLAFKEDKIRGNLMRIGEVPAEVLDQAMEPIVGMDNPFHYRNKAQFPIGTDKEGTHHNRILRRKDPQHHPKYRLRAGRGSKRNNPEADPCIYGRV